MDNSITSHISFLKPISIVVIYEILFRAGDYMDILKKEDFIENLRNHYELHYGKRDSDIWHEQPAVNVWVFERDSKIITLMSHILTGIVEENIENI